MRSFLRLPPFLRAVLAGGALCSLAAVSLMAAFDFLDRSASHETFVRNLRLLFVAINLTALSVACSFYGLVYVVVFITRPLLRQPARRRLFPLDSWRSQALAFAVMAGPPLCGLLLALVTALSPTVAVDPDVALVVFLVALGWPVIAMGLLALL